MSCNSHFDRLKIVRKGDCLARKICLYSLCPKYINADVNLLEIIEEKEKKRNYSCFLQLSRNVKVL